jgi:hypothetical protein
MFDFVGQFVKGRMPVNFVVRRLEKGIGVFGGGVDVFGFDYPNTDAFIAAAIYVAGIFQCHLGIGGVEATDVFMAEALF